MNRALYVEKIQVNRGAGTAELLSHKTTADLDEKELSRFFEKERVQRILNDLEQSASDLTAQEKLRQLALAENGHLFKGTFLCLGKQQQIPAVCPTATEAKFILFKGTDRVDILVLETLQGNLLRQFDKMLLLLRTHIPLGRDRARNEDIYEIPIIAVREFVANAFVHRDYGSDVQSYIQIELFDDRLEIKSPGHLPPNVDVNKIEGTVLINPVIAAVFHLCQYIERAGTGIRVAQQALKAHGLKAARIENIDHPKMVKVTIFRNQRGAAGHTPGGLWDTLRKKMSSVFS
jgi:predicted HTH transcriptional regulator